MIKLLAEIGILLLLFEVGLETDIRKLMRTGRSSSIVAFGGFLIPFVLGFFLAHQLFDLSVLVSLFIGGALTATSIGITIRVLTDLHQRNTREGQIVLGAAVLDDVLGVVLLALLYEFSIAGGITLANTSKVLAFIGLFFILAPIAAKLISLLIKHFDDIRVSRPAESHRQPLAEPYVTLSRHTAPIIRPFACPLQCTKA
ncbi:cation:proton antiporter, partial [Thiolapillus sp.]|uniref:cation:proton antiporter n=1 Tax=Thiolapillus sp. TaxID=2017437 RepID=UPI003AF5549A